MKKVSVIIPMYNAENTIGECLDSLVAQTIFPDMEIIVVDDFSSDHCLHIVEIYEQKYPEQFIVIKLDKNGGPGRARNIALEYATSEYIGYVDSDDAAYPIMFEKLYDEAKRTKADVVDGGFYNQKDDVAIVYASDDLVGLMDSKKRSGLIIAGGYIWSKIYKRDFLITERIRFREDYVLEDMDYLTEVFLKVKTMANVKEILYVYRDSSGSLSKTIDVYKYIRNLTSAMNAVYEKAIQADDYEGSREAVEYTLIQLYSYSVNMCLRAIKDSRYSRDSVKQVLYALKDMKNLYVKGDYNNQYVQKKISKRDIDIMEINDIMPEKLLEIF